MINKTYSKWLGLVKKINSWILEINYNNNFLMKLLKLLILNLPYVKIIILIQMVFKKYDPYFEINRKKCVNKVKWNSKVVYIKINDQRVRIISLWFINYAEKLKYKLNLIVN